MSNKELLILSLDPKKASHFIFSRVFRQHSERTNLYKVIISFGVVNFLSLFSVLIFRTECTTKCKDLFIIIY